MGWKASLIILLFIVLFVIVKMLLVIKEVNFRELDYIKGEIASQNANINILLDSYEKEIERSKMANGK